MAKRGSPKGTNRGGGRRLGQLNKATIERFEKERLAAEAMVVSHDVALAQHKKLGKEVLQDYMETFGQFAAFYQNKIVEKLQKHEEPTAAEWDAFERWAVHASTCARDVAGYQSPKFKSVMVAVQPTPGDGARTVNPKRDNVVTINDPQALYERYKSKMKLAIGNG